MLTINGLTKSYGAHQVLSGLSLHIAPGKIQGIVGENGAGKSTLVKCLMGLIPPDSGEIRRNGVKIAAIYQEFNLANALTVAENIYLGREPRRGMFVDRAAMRAGAAAQLARLHKHIDPDAPVGGLTIFEKQAVEIAKALTGECDLLIMDEPSTLLNREETATLFDIMRRFVGSPGAGSRGKAIIYISHKLAEVREICDDIAVLRDGVLISNTPAGELDVFELARRMVGRELTRMFPPKLSGDAGAAVPALQLENVVSLPKVEGVSLTLNPGEILGLAGLAGAGRTELAETICALRRLEQGTIRLNGEKVSFRNPGEALAAGISYLSEDRKESGILTAFSIAENIALPNLQRYAPRGWIRREMLSAVAAEYLQRFKINAAGIDAPLSSLSGGNQQKVALAKGLDSRPKVFIFDEPTRGVDVAARRDIYDFIHDFAAAGAACLMICSDLEELIGMCSRVLVMRKGKIAGELTGEAVNEEEIMYLATGAK